MRMLHYWARIIRGRWFRSLGAALLIVLIGIALPASGAGAASRKSGKSTHGTTKGKKKKKSPPSKKAPAARKYVPAPPPPPRTVPGPSTPLQSMVRRLRDTPTPANRAALAAYAASQKGVNAGLASLGLGLADVERKQFASAPASLKTAQARVPPLADYAGYWSASALVETGTFDDALTALEPVWAASPDSPVLADAVLVAARAHLQKGNPARAVSLLRSFSTRLAQPRGEAMLARCLEANNEPQAAAASWQHVYYDYPMAPESADAAAALSRLRGTLGNSFPAPTPAMLLGRVDRMTGGKQFATARRELEGLAASLTGAGRDAARVRLGSVAYQAGDYADALRYLKTVQADTPDADAERLYYMAAVYRRLDNDEEFNRTVERLSRYPKSRWRLQALVLAGNRYMLRNEPDKYERFFKTAYEGFPDQPDAAYCHWRVAWRKYLQRHDDAEEYLRRHLKLFPASDKAPAALYFLGRLAESKNKPNAARTWYNELRARFPNGYYAIIGRGRVAALPPPAGVPAVAYTAGSDHKTKAASGLDTAVVKFLQEVEWPVRGQNLAFESTPAIRYRLERARLLQTAGLDDLAENELRYGARNEGPAPLLAMELAALATRKGSPDQGIRFIKGLCPDYLYLPMDAAPAAFWRFAFPLPYRTELETSARQYDLDPYAVAALIRQESEFNPRALSYAKAQGLTQVMPATGKYLSKRVGLKRFSPSMLWRPDVNLKLGTYYLHSLLTSFDGRWEPALASYNAGKSRVDTWLTWADYKEPAEFVENIPIAQTRDYVQIVLRDADLYRKLYGASAPAVTSTNGTAARNRPESRQPGPLPKRSHL